MKVFAFLLLMLIWVTPRAQTPDIPALLDSLAKSRTDSTSIDLMVALGYAYENQFLDSAIYFFNRAISLSSSSGDLKREMNIKGAVGAYWWSVGDFSTAIRLQREVEKYLTSQKDTLNLGVLYSELLSTYRDEGDYSEALRYAYRGMQIFPDTSFAASMENAMTGSVYFEMGNIDSAYYYLSRSLTFPQNVGPGWILLMNGRVNAKRDSNSRALGFYRRAEVELKNAGNVKDLAQDYNSIGDLYLKTGKADSAIFYGNKALNISLSKRFRREMIQSYQLLSEAFSKTDIPVSFNYFKLASATRDTIFSQASQRAVMSQKFDDQLKETELENLKEQNASRNRLLILLFVLLTVLILSIFLVRNNRRKQRVNVLLRMQKEKIETAMAELKTTQEQLIQSEKMASLGEVTAGIAHEMQNPLNFVNNFSELNLELLGELMKSPELIAARVPNEMVSDIVSNSDKILFHGKRAEAIVKGMLAHSRRQSDEKKWILINDLCEDVFKISYQAEKNSHPETDIRLLRNYSPGAGQVKLVESDFSRALLNIFDNAFYEVRKKAGLLRSATASYSPSVSVSTDRADGKIEIRIRDNGTGIPGSVQNKIFQPFFTTKPAGEGTGLGLALVYDVITKVHQGSIALEESGDNGTCFLIQVPEGDR